jgi:hypothetical protein
MTADPTIARIRAVRHQISERYHHDAQQIITHYIEREQQHEGRFLDLTAGTITAIEGHGRPLEKRNALPVNMTS